MCGRRTKLLEMGAPPESETSVRIQASSRDCCHVSFWTIDSTPMSARLTDYPSKTSDGVQSILVHSAVRQYNVSFGEIEQLAGFPTMDFSYLKKYSTERCVN
jgi:hypothetical protein